MNIYDVSQKAGVSIATVSRVINGNDNVSEKTRNKVLAVMKELGYTPNVFARGLNLNTMKTIGIMCSDSSDTYLANAIYYLEHELRKNGYDSFLCCSGYELENKQNYFRLLLSKRVDAMILVGSSFLDLKTENNQYIMDGALQVPVMLMNSVLDAPNIYSIVCNDKDAVSDAVNRLVLEDRRRILFLYRRLSYSGYEKLSGYKTGLTQCGIAVDDTLIRQCPKGLNSIKKFIAGLFEEGLQFDSILASEDIIAIGALKTVQANGYCVPDDFSIIGFNNSLLTQCCQPELTSIDNHVEHLSTATVQLLMNVLAGQSVPQTITISASLVVRDSTRS